VFKASNNLCIAGSKRGILSVWLPQTGELLAEIESAHYNEITTLDLTDQMIATGGKDAKVKVWLISNIITS